MPSGENERLPKKCTRVDEDGNLPTCTQVGDGGWQVSYPDTGPDAGGVPGFFAVFFVLALVGGLAMTAWKVSTARRIARSAGMDERDATKMALFTDDGFEATYLAANLRPQGGPAAAPDSRGDAARRLQELQGLLDQGLITEEEHAERRLAILDSL